MPVEKKVILQSRLQRRLKELQINDFREYVDYVFSADGQSKELMHMIDVITTNKTDFYREKEHFELLNDTLLSELTSGTEFIEPLNIWSAGCSSGEEAYTIAFTIEEFQERNHHFDYKIFGSDISGRIIKKAVDAIFPEENITGIPLEIKKKYFLISKDKNSPTVRIKPFIRNKTIFGRLNLMDDKYNVPNNLDIVFCRNVLIYFNRPTQIAVLHKLISKLKVGGYLFLGHSESIIGIDLPLIRVKSTVFMKKSN
jgi:chemotaxis protein methyltransferase CheR